MNDRESRRERDEKRKARHPRLVSQSWKQKIWCVTSGNRNPYATTTAIGERHELSNICFVVPPQKHFPNTNSWYLWFPQILFLYKTLSLCHHLGDTSSETTAQIHLVTSLETTVSPEGNKQLMNHFITSFGEHKLLSDSETVVVSNLNVREARIVN